MKYGARKEDLDTYIFKTNIYNVLSFKLSLENGLE